ncbi:MAG: hypothetical protein M1829_000793 [Trizodia sp. TS-e1964]|nr:MAG: hypothetical protein M1829_000793 [Trizodia sp. TS-e1964]
MLWIQKLLDTTGPKYSDKYDAERDVIGLDIGTGASCIYPLLGCALRPKWKFIATDIDEVNLEFSQQNVDRNQSKQRIKIFKSTSRDGPLIPLDSIGITSIDFTICNPPFYESKQEMILSAEDKQRPPFSACTGAEVEMVTPGGEANFVGRMIDESFTLKHRVQWYSSMLGKFSSISTVVDQLRKAGVKNWAVTELVQGNKTRRWAIAWSWGPMRPMIKIARGIPGLPHSQLAFPSEYVFFISKLSVVAITESMRTTLGELDLHWQWKPAQLTGIVFSKGNVWSRASRRRKRPDDEKEKEASEGEEDDVALGVKIHLKPEKAEDAKTDVIIRWLQGNDSVIFESFCGMLRRKIAEA